MEKQPFSDLFILAVFTSRYVYSICFPVIVIQIIFSYLAAHALCFFFYIYQYLSLFRKLLSVSIIIPKVIFHSDLPHN
jgi:hypothetical protein